MSDHPVGGVLVYLGADRIDIVGLQAMDRRMKAERLGDHEKDSDVLLHLLRVFVTGRNIVISCVVLRVICRYER
jgi:hypothetical protein